MYDLLNVPAQLLEELTFFIYTTWVLAQDNIQPLQIQAG